MERFANFSPNQIRREAARVSTGQEIGSIIRKLYDQGNPRWFDPQVFVPRLGTSPNTADPKEISRVLREAESRFGSPYRNELQTSEQLQLMRGLRDWLMGKTV